MDHNKTRETNRYQPCQRTINRRLEIPFEFSPNFVPTNKKKYIYEHYHYHRINCMRFRY